MPVPHRSEPPQNYARKSLPSGRKKTPPGDRNPPGRHTRCPLRRLPRSHPLMPLHSDPCVAFCVWPCLCFLLQRRDSLAMYNNLVFRCFDECAKVSQAARFDFARRMPRRRHLVRRCVGVYKLKGGSLQKDIANSLPLPTTKLFFRVFLFACGGVGGRDVNVKRCVRAKGAAKRAALGTLQALWLRERPVCAPSVPEGFGGASRSKEMHGTRWTDVSAGSLRNQAAVDDGRGPETVASSTFLASRYLLQAIRPYPNFVPRRVVRYFVGTYR